jgi:hypothetical protein
MLIACGPEGKLIGTLLEKAMDKTPYDDWVQARVIARARELEMTAYAIAKTSDGRVSEDHVQAYLTKRKSMGSHKLQHVLRALRLEILPHDDKG